MNRRQFLMGSTVAGAVTAAGACAPLMNDTRPPHSQAAAVDPEIVELEKRTFDWFVHVTDRERGLTPDRWPSQSACSIAAVGFALTCWPVGVVNGWMTRAEARARTLNTVRFFHVAPQGPDARGMTGHKGFFYHFIDMETGHRRGTSEVSTVDTTLLLGGMLFAAQWFDGEDADEVEIRRLVQAIYDRIEWDWVVVRPNRIAMGWRPERGYTPADWNVYNEGMLTLLLAIGSQTHPVPASVWEEWCSVYDRSWTDKHGPLHLHFAPMFGHQYSHMYVDFRGIQDPWMRETSQRLGRPFDYFMNSQLAVQAQRTYAIRNPGGWAGYDTHIWGLTACDGPGNFRQDIRNRERQFWAYSARGPGERDDGTIAPTAAMASFPFAPDDVTDCLKSMKARYGQAIYTELGFLDSFNPTLTERSGELARGRIVPEIGWVDDDYLGIDQGPIVVMIENHRSDLVWSRMRREPNLRRGLERAGFTGGWLLSG